MREWIALRESRLLLTKHKEVDQGECPLHALHLSFLQGNAEMELEIEREGPSAGHEVTQLGSLPCGNLFPSFRKRDGEVAPEIWREYPSARCRSARLGKQPLGILLLDD